MVLSLLTFSLDRRNSWSWSSFLVSSWLLPISNIFGVDSASWSFTHFPHCNKQTITAFRKHKVSFIYSFTCVLNSHMLSMVIGAQGPYTQGSHREQYKLHLKQVSKSQTSVIQKGLQYSFCPWRVKLLQWANFFLWLISPFSWRWHW